MGTADSKLKERYLFAIVANKEGDLAQILTVKSLITL